MIDRDTKIPVVRQCEVLDLSRASVYYPPRTLPEVDLGLMRRIDEPHLKHLFLGARKLAAILTRKGFPVGRRHVGTLMRKMGIEAIYRNKRTSIPDNVFVERLWRSVKYEEVYLHAYDTPSEANTALERYFRFYNARRPRQGLDDLTPDAVYFGKTELRQAA
jgi:hypothetical protein